MDAFLPAQALGAQGNATLEAKFPHDAVGLSRRCKSCLDDIVGPVDRTRRNQMTKFTTQCQHCGNCGCKTHLMRICKDCAATAVFPGPNAAPQGPPRPPRREVS